MPRRLRPYGVAKGADLINDILAREVHAIAVPDAEEIPSAGRPLSDRRGVLFVGNFAHPPNIDAVHFFSERILPHIDQTLLEKHPIMIVGNALTDAVRALCDRAGMKAIGWVPSVAPYLEEARVSVVPLRSGAGTKRKLIKAVLSGLPTVSTPISASKASHFRRARVCSSKPTHLSSREASSVCSAMTCFGRRRRMRGATV